MPCYAATMNAARTEHPYQVEILAPRVVTLWRGECFAEAVAAYEREAMARPAETVALCCGARIIRRSR